MPCIVEGGSWEDGDWGSKVNNFHWGAPHVTCCKAFESKFFKNAVEESHKEVSMRRNVRSEQGVGTVLALLLTCRRI